MTFLPSDPAGLDWPCCDFHAAQSTPPPGPDQPRTTDPVPRGVVCDGPPTERLPTVSTVDEQFIEALRQFTANLKAATDELAALTRDLLAEADEPHPDPVTYDQFMHALSHCDECGCLHGEPEVSCECVCHGPVDVSPQEDDPPVGG